MKITFLLLLLPLSLFALSKESCYTVQLISAYNNEKNYEMLESKVYDASCKLMKIGKVLTVRCGCFESYKDVKKHLQKLKKSYHDASIMTTYKSRFTPVIAAPTIMTASALAPKPKAEFIELKLPTVTEEKRVQKKKNIIQITQGNITRVEKHAEQKKKKEKKKKKKQKKVKYVKKKGATFFYDRYIAMIPHSVNGVGSWDYRYSFGARVSYDMVYVDEAESAYFDRGLRRVRLSHEGSFFDKKLFYEFEYSLIGTSNYKNVYMGYQNKYEGLYYRIKAGNLKVPFSLERYSSSKYLTFMERSLNDAFALSRKLGAEVLLSYPQSSNYINLFGAYFGNSIDERQDDKNPRDGFSTRFTWSDKLAKRHFVECGFAYRKEDNYKHKVKISQAAESDRVVNKYVSVKVKNVDTITTKNFEALYLNHKYSFLGEYTMQTLDAKKGKYNFYGYYLEGSYFLLGRGKRFKQETSTLAKIKPTKDGALELAMRYAYINLNDKDEHGGEQRDVTLGVNWYIDDKLRVSGNYIIANPINTDDYNGIFQVWQARILFFF